MDWLRRGRRSSPVWGSWAAESRRVTAAATHLWGLPCNQVMGPAPGAQAGALQEPRDAPPWEGKSILSHPEDIPEQCDPQTSYEDTLAVAEQGLLLGITGQELGTCPCERVEEVALGVDDGKPKEIAASTTFSEVLPALLHTQGGESKPGLELVPLAPT